MADNPFRLIPTQLFVQTITGAVVGSKPEPMSPREREEWSEQFQDFTDAGSFRIIGAESGAEIYFNPAHVVAVSVVVLEEES